MLRIAAYSDIHGVLPEDIPECDMVILGGDNAPFVDHSIYYQRNWYQHDFRLWAEKIDKPIIMIAGNHDFLPQADDTFKWWIEAQNKNVYYLQDNFVTISEVKFWGSPWVLPIGNWAFQAGEPLIEHKFDDIPLDTDVIISHSPPFQKQDRCLDGHHAGLRPLTAAIRRVSPDVVVCGHIHEAYGVCRYAGARIINASIMDAAYKPNNLPIVFNIK